MSSFVLFVFFFFFFPTFSSSSNSPPPLLHFSIRACATNHLDFIDQLLRATDVDVNARDLLHRTPLHYAAIQGHIEAVRKLVDKGAVLDAQVGLRLVKKKNRSASAKAEGHRQAEGHRIVACVFHQASFFRLLTVL